MSAEKINTQYRHETDSTQENETPVGVQSELRDTLLEAPEGVGSFVRVPEGTVAIDATSGMLDPETLAGLSAEAEDTVQRWRSGEHIPVFGHSRVAEFATLVEMMRGSARIDRETNQPLDMTLLYDQDAATENDEPAPPSAVLVHQKLTPEQVMELRANLPPGVPLLDSRTNELLDGVGAEQRAESRHRERAWRNLGHFVLIGPDFTNRSSHPKRERAYTHGPSFDDFDWMNREDLNDMNARFRRVDEEFATGQQEQQETNYDYDFSDFWARRDDQETPRTTYPESDEVRQHRERVERAESMLNEAAAKYGADRWQDLDPRDQERARRRVLRSVHPDLEGGDKALFQEVEFMTKDIRAEQSQAGGPSEPAQSEARPATPEADSSNPNSEPPVSESEPAPHETREPLQLEPAREEAVPNGDDEENDPESLLEDEDEAETSRS